LEEGQTLRGRIYNDMARLGLIKQPTIPPLQKFLVELLLFLILSSEPWWRARLFCFRRGGRSDLGRRGGFGLLAANVRLFFVSLIRLLVGATLPVTNLILRITKLTLPVAGLALPGTRLALPVSRLALPVTKSTLPVKLRTATQSANAIVLRVRTHYPAVRALGGYLAAERFTLLVLGHCETCKTAHGTKYRNSEKYLDHVPTLLNGLASVPHSAAPAEMPFKC